MGLKLIHVSDVMPTWILAPGFVIIHGYILGEDISRASPEYKKYETKKQMWELSAHVDD